MQSLRFLSLEADGLPGLVHCLLDARVARKERTSRSAREVGEGLHLHIRAGCRPGQSLIPDLPCLVPALSPNRHRRLEEGEVRHTARIVRVHAAMKL